MENVQEIRKRDKRNPRHCWQDNELYDVFQPVIGALATHVFAVMTRWAYGHEVQMGMRELAEEAAVSRSTAHRALMSMQALGMVRLRPGSGRAATAWDLLDLKDAARAAGAQPIGRGGTLALTRGQISTLKKRVAGALRSVSVRDANGDQQAASVSVRDATECGNVAVASQLVSQNEARSVPKPGALLIKQDSKTLQSSTPAPPSPGGGEGSTLLHGDGKERAPRKVFAACGVTDERLQRKIERAMGDYAAREHLGWAEADEAMVQAWADYAECAQWMRYQWRPDKFFTHGHWLHPDAWPVDHGRLQQERMDRRAKVGMR